MKIYQFINIYSPKNRASKMHESKLAKLKEQIIQQLTVGDFNITTFNNR